MDQLTRAADALQILGGSLYVIHPGGEDHDWAWERAARLERSVVGLGRMWDICRERGLTLVVETPLPHLLGGHPADFDWILERLPREHTGVCVDTSHCALGRFLIDSIHRLAPRLLHVQASDNRGSSDDHLEPGGGTIDWPGVIGALQAARYQGVFMLEVSGLQEPPMDVDRAIAGTRRVSAIRAALRE